MLGRFTLGLLVVGTFGAADSTATPTTLQAEPKGRYEWRILVRFAQHPQLGPIARSQLVKAIRTALTPAIGADLGGVEVTDLDSVPKDKWEPLWARWDEVGWSALESAEFRKLTGVKTHFLKVQLKNGRYVLESRQHDGYCGLPSPHVRTRTVVDPLKLGREAGLMLYLDFGPVGTVEPLPETKSTCLIRLRGGVLPGFDRWVRPGDVFTFSVVSAVARPLPKDAKPPRPGRPEEPPTDLVAQPQQVTLLRVLDLPKPGIARCEILSSQREPLIVRRGVVGYRAMKLATRDRPLSLRVVDQNDRPPPATTPLEVWATDNGFRDEPTTSDTMASRNGVYTTGRVLRGVGCVWVKLGSSAVRPYVLPVLDTDEPHTIRFEFNETTVKVANFENLVERFQQRAMDARLAQDELFLALRGLIDKQQNQQALDRARNGLKSTSAADADLTSELAKLRQHELAKTGRIERMLASSEQWLASLRQGQPELEQKINDLKLAIEKANNPAEFERQFKANELSRQINYHERRGEVQEALDVYDELYNLTKQDEVKQRRQKLADEWAVKSPQQGEARTYLTDEWAKLSSLEEFKAGVPKLRQAVDALIAQQDRLGLRLAVTNIRVGYARLSEVVNTLDPQLVQDKEQILAVKAVRDDIQKIEQDAQTEVNKLDVRK